MTPSNLGERLFYKVKPILPWALMAIIVYLPYLSLIPVNDWWLFGLEDGSHLSWIQAMKKGFIPYRDFYAQYGPLNILLYKIPMDIFGYQLSVYRWSMVIFNLLSMIISLMLAFLVIKRIWLRLLIVFPIVLAVHHPMWFHYWGGLRMGSGLLGLYFFVKYFDNKKNIWLILSGAMSVLSFFISYEEGASLIAGAAMVFAYSAAFSNVEWRLGKKQLKAFGGSVFLTLILVIGYMIYQGMVLAYFKISFIDVLFYQQISWTKFALPLIDAFPNERGIAILFSREIFFWILYAIIIFSLFAFFKWYRQLPVILLLSVFALIHMISSTRLYKGPQLNTSLPAIAILIFFFSNEVIDKFKSKSWKIAVIFLLLFIFSGYMINFSFNMLKVSSGTQDNKISLLKYERRNVNVPRMRNVKLSIPQAKVVEEVCNSVDYYTKPDDRILCGPYHSTFTFICDRMFYSRFYIPLLSTIRKEFYIDILQDIKKNPPPLVVWETDALRIMPHIDHDSLLKELYDIIKMKYILVKDIPKDTKLKNPGPWGNVHTQIFVLKELYKDKGDVSLR